MSFPESRRALPPTASSISPDTIIPICSCGWECSGTTAFGSRVTRENISFSPEAIFAVTPGASRRGAMSAGSHIRCIAAPPVGLSRRIRKHVPGVGDDERRGQLPQMTARLLHGLIEGRRGGHPHPLPVLRAQGGDEDPAAGGGL